MFETSTVLLIFFIYMGGLFLIALTVERNQALSAALARRPWIYALSITVYATSWTFYGSVGLASKSGLIFLPTYLGPTVAIGLWWVLLRKMVRIKEKRSVTSIADFISARYDRSQGVAMIVTLIALLGTLPYIALQLKAVVTSFSVITGAPETELDWDGIGLWITLLLIAFSVLFGARRLDPTERHQGMMAALAVECFVKLLAFLAVGIFVTYHMFDGFADLLGQLPVADRQQLTQVGDDQYQSYVRWMTVFFLSMAGILFLPRQFHTAVIENSNEEHIRTAIWLVPAYLLLMSLFVVPLAAAGRVQGLPPQLAEFFVLLLPMQADQNLLAVLVFIGGLAAASGMIIISSVTLSTMATNHLLLPVLNHFAPLHFLKRYLLPARWVAIAFVLLFGYLFARELTAGRLLVNIGILGFCAALQFVPAIVGGLFWLRGNKTGALLGLSSGFILWFYTLMVPMLAQGGLLPLSWLSEGPLGIGMLRPEALFGLERFDSVTHASFWSLFFNSGFYMLGSLLARQKESELEMASAYVYALHFNPPGETGHDGENHIDKTDKLQEATALLEHYLSEKIARSKIRQITEGMGIAEQDMISAGDLLRFHRELERVLAGSIGSAAAHQAMKQHLSYSEVEHGQVSQVYAGILANLQLSPDELLERISYFEERDKAQKEHSRELEARVTERESEIRARRRAEKEADTALQSQQLLNELLALSLESVPLERILRRALTTVFNQSWLPAEPRGAVFLADNQQRKLRLVAQQGLEEIEIQCSVVDYDQCLCGKAAVLRQAMHSSEVDLSDGSFFPGVEKQGHYVVPIMADGELLGILLLYVPLDHQKHAREVLFLESVANSLGGLIQRNRTEQALNETRLRLQGFLDNTPAMIYLKDHDGRYLMVNGYFERIMNLQAEAVIGHHQAELLDQVAALPLHENDLRVIESGEATEIEELIPQADGVHTYLSVKFPLRDGNGRIVALGNISTDISNRIQVEQDLQMAYSSLEQRVEERTGALSQTLIQMEKEIDRRIQTQQALEQEQQEQQALIEELEATRDQLLQSEKMAAIGQLAAGVAHEINNPVGYISSNITSLKTYVGDLKKLLEAYAHQEQRLSVPDEEISRVKADIDFEFLQEDIDSLLSESMEGVDRVRKIVKDLKDFSHSDQGEWETVDLHQCLDSTLNVVWNELKYKAEVVKEYAELPPVTCLASQLSQVFMNLLVNAAHAIEDHGVIRVRTGDAGERVWVEISDTGSGISEELQKRIFEPFFTTKPVGKGTGLGLSLSYGIIEKHGGSIDLHSKPGEGSRFRIWLPKKQSLQSSKSQPAEQTG